MGRDGPSTAQTANAATTTARLRFMVTSLETREPVQRRGYTEAGPEGRRCSRGRAQGRRGVGHGPTPDTLIVTIAATAPHTASHWTDFRTSSSSDFAAPPASGRAGAACRPETAWPTGHTSRRDVQDGAHKRAVRFVTGESCVGHSTKRPASTVVGTTRGPVRPEAGERTPPPEARLMADPTSLPSGRAEPACRPETAWPAGHTSRRDVQDGPHKRAVRIVTGESCVGHGTKRPASTVFGTTRGPVPARRRRAQRRRYRRPRRSGGRRSWRRAPHRLLPDRSFGCRRPATSRSPTPSGRAGSEADERIRRQRRGRSPTLLRCLRAGPACRPETARPAGHTSHRDVQDGPHQGAVRDCARARATTRRTARPSRAAAS